MGIRWATIGSLGDSALRVDCGEVSDSSTADRVAAATTALNARMSAMIRDVVPAWTTIAVHYDAARLLAETRRESPFSRVKAWVEEQLSSVPSRVVATGQREVVVPVVYGGSRGPDLEDVAGQRGLSCDDIVHAHVNASYRVRAIGFTPGFAYLEGLPTQLATPRRTSPRTQVPGGSVGIGGGQTGVYPLASPGGWNLIGQTATTLFDVSRQPPCYLEVGDRVQFVVGDEEQFLKLPHDSPPHHGGKKTEPTGPVIAEVIVPGFQTLIQAAPRWGQQQWGVTPGGSMGSVAACLANRVVGNAPDLPVIETMLRGPKLRWRRRVLATVMGAAPEGIPTGRPLLFAKGETIDLTRLAGARCCLAVAGGFAAEEALGGSGTHLQLGVGGHEGRPLQKGDLLRLATSTPSPQAARKAGGAWFVDSRRLIDDPAGGELRLVRGPQAKWFSPAAWKQLLSSEYRVSPRSDRMGIRLEGEPLTKASDREMVSEGVVTGAIQVPPDGQPIILGVDRQTIGGYPMMACVVSVDWGRLAQLSPGMSVRFCEVSHAEAEELLARRQQCLGFLETGLACHA